MKVHLRRKEGKTKVTLYLDIHRGKGGRPKLSQWLYPKPKTAEQKRHNEQALTIAEKLRAEAETEQLYTNTDLAIPYKVDSPINDYFQEWVDNYQKADIRKAKSALKNWKLFQNKMTLTFKDLNNNVLTDYKDFLVAKHASETARAYFGKFKQVLGRAYDAKYSRYNPGDFRGNISKGKRTLRKEILTPEELQKLAKTHCDNPTIKWAFVFCSFTGLEFTDVLMLKWDKIKGDAMKSPRRKTGVDRFMHLHDSALAVLKKMDKSTEYVFQDLPNREKPWYSNNACNKTLKALVERAEIKKHITWYGGRHYFGTWMDGEDGTVAELLGHTDTSMVKVYRRIRDEKKAAAVNSLPGIEL